MRFSDIEKKHLLKSWIIVSLVFSIGSIARLNILAFFVTFALSALTVGIGFIVHELSHKLFAQKYGYLAEYRANDQMLLISLALALFGFIFIAPGAVIIQGSYNQSKNGKISLAGPLSNLVLALIFLGIMLFSPISMLSLIASYGFQVNTWLGLFNLLPFGNFDGVKILRWNRLVYFATITFAGALMMVSYI